MKWFHKARLNRLADKLEGKGPYIKAGPIPREKFDMEYLFSARPCALGWMLSDPWFNDRCDLGVTEAQYRRIFLATSYRAQRNVHPRVVAKRLRVVARHG